MGRTMDKAKLLAAIEREHKRLDETLALVDDSQMLELNFEGGWSIKDLLAHITFWNKSALINVHAALNKSKPTEFEGTTNSINARAFEEAQNRSLKQVLSDYESSYEQVLDNVVKLDEEDLTDSKRFTWTKRLPLRRLIRWDTDLHYAEHNRQIRAWLEESSASPS